MDTIYLSIIIATFNRSSQVLECLKETARQARNFSDVEVIVVDNNSKDNTNEVVEAFIKQSGINCRYTLETTPGVNSARNRGCSLAKGEIIALLDDDAIPLEGWVEKIRNHFIEQKSDVLAGRVELITIASQLPEWFPKDLSGILGKTEYGTNSRLMDMGENPQSGNCAFRIEVFNAVGGFNPKSLIYGDETEFFQRVWDKGFSFIYRHDIVVDHCISIDRLSEESLYQKGYMWGKGSAVNFLLRSPSWAQRTKRIFEFAARITYLKLRCSLSPNFSRLYTYNFNLGHIQQLIKGLQ